MKLTSLTFILSAILLQGEGQIMSGHLYTMPAWTEADNLTGTRQEIIDEAKNLPKSIWLLKETNDCWNVNQIVKHIAGWELPFMRKVSQTTLPVLQHSLKKIWITDTIIPVPESVLYNDADKTLFVSLIDGSPAERDGKGGIARLGSDGTIIDLHWITGLNAPKGMARYKDVLYVADLTELVVIDLKQSKVVKRIAVDSAVALNDVTVDKKGIVYASDPRAKRVFRIENNKASVYLNQLIKPNGLKFIGNFLYMLDNGSLYKIDKRKNKKTIAAGMDENTDGIEQIKKGEYIISCWTGVIYHVTEAGNTQVLLDTRKEEYYTADIGYDAKTKTVYVPSLFRMTVSAYKFQ